MKAARIALAVLGMAIPLLPAPAVQAGTAAPKLAGTTVVSARRSAWEPR
jgi:hypothetical protein